MISATHSRIHSFVPNSQARKSKKQARMSLVGCEISRCVPVNLVRDIPKSMKVFGDLKNVSIQNNEILNGLLESIYKFDINRVFWVNGVPYKFKLVHLTSRYATFIQMYVRYDIKSKEFLPVTLRKVKLSFA